MWHELHPLGMITVIPHHLCLPCLLCSPPQISWCLFQFVTRGHKQTRGQRVQEKKKNLSAGMKGWSLVSVRGQHPSQKQRQIWPDIIFSWPAKESEWAGVTAHISSEIMDLSLRLTDDKCFPSCSDFIGAFSLKFPYVCLHSQIDGWYVWLLAVQL